MADPIMDWHFHIAFTEKWSLPSSREPWSFYRTPSCGYQVWRNIFKRKEDKDKKTKYIRVRNYKYNQGKRRWK